MANGFKSFDDALFNGITDSLAMLQEAQDLLVKAHQEAEEIVINESSDKIKPELFTNPIKKGANPLELTPFNVFTLFTY